MPNYNYHPFLKSPVGISIEHIDLKSRILLEPFEKLMHFYKKSIMDMTLDPHLSLAMVTISTRDNSKLQVALLIPERIENHRLFFHCHGGGFLLPLHPQVMHIASQYALHYNAIIAIPDYRSAIHHPYPISLNDCFDSFKFISKYFNLTNYCLYGDSAGGCLAIQLNRLIYQSNLQMPKVTVLTYPVTDNALNYDSIEKYKRSEVWNKNANQAMWDILLSDDSKIDNLAIPMQINDLSHFGPTIIDTCEYDVLHDQGIAFANKLATFNNEVYKTTIPKAYHGFDNDVTNPFVKTVFYNRFSMIDHYLK